MAELSEIPTIVLVKVPIHGSLPPSRVSQKVKGLEPQRHKGRLFLPAERSPDKHRKNFVSSCLCGSLLFRVFCDTLLREDDGWLVFSTMPSHLVLFAVKENCHGGTEKRKKLCLCVSVAKAFMTEGDQ